MSTDDQSAPRRRGDHARADRGREWELFVRESVDEPLTHAGSVTAPTESLAHDRAASLVGWNAEAVWLCPADETARFGGRRLGEDDTAPDDGDDRNRTTGEPEGDGDPAADHAATGDRGDPS